MAKEKKMFYEVPQKNELLVHNSIITLDEHSSKYETKWQLSTSLCCLQTLSTYLGVVAFGAMGVAILELWIQTFPTR